MLHLAFGIVSGWLRHCLQCFAIIFGRQCNKLRFRVVSCGFDGLIVLNDDAIDIVVNSLAQEVVRVDVVERRNDDLNTSKIVNGLVSHMREDR